MKVLMFGWEFPPHISGGLGTACFGLTRGMARLAAEIIFVLPQLREPAESSQVRLVAADEVGPPLSSTLFPGMNDWLKIIEIASPLHPYLNPDSYRTQLIERLNQATVSDRHHDQDPGGLLHFHGEYEQDLLDEVARYGVIGGRLAATHPHDVIHAHDWMTYPAGVEAKRISGKPLIVHVHATEFDRSGEHVNQAIYDLERYGMHSADRVIAVSERTRHVVIERYGVDPEKTRVVHNAVAKEKLIDRHQVVRHLDEKIVLFLGRVTMQKGPDYFVEAAARVLQKVRNVRFVMAGSGDMLPAMIDRAAELRIADRFHFTGFLEGADVDLMYALCDLYVMPSVSEPFGITPFEAIKHDVPVIISRQSGVAEVLPHAIKVDFWDIDRLSESIIDVLSKADHTRDLVEKHRQDLASIDWVKAAQLTLDVYAEVVQS